MAILISWKFEGFVVLIILFVFACIYLSRKHNYWKKKGIFYVKPLPFFGNFLSVCLLRRSVGEILRDIYETSKDSLVGFYVFDEPCLLIRSPKVVSEMFVKNFNSFCDRNTASNEKDDPIAANMIFSLKSEVWKPVRSRMTPFFSTGNMKQIFIIMNNLAKDLNSYINESCLSKSMVDGKDLGAKYSTDLISWAAFGIGANCIKSENADFRNVSKKLIEFSFSRSIQVLIYFFVSKLVIPLKIKFFDPKSVIYFKNALWHSIQERDKNGIKRNDMIDIFLQVRKEMQENKINYFDDNKITGQAALLFLAGYEPMSAAIGYGLYELSLQPELQHRLRTEIRETLQKHNGDLLYEDLKDMEYLDMVVSESLRKYPMLSFIQRKCVKDYNIPNSNITIEKGTSVYFSLYGIQNDNEYYSNPEEYNPERFSKENKKNITPYTFVPFGVGPHKCLGERFGWLGVKVALIHILKDYEVVTTKYTPVSVEFEPIAFILHPKFGLPVRFQRCS